MKNILFRTFIILIIALICMQTFAFAVDNPDYYEPNKMSDKDKDEIGTATGNILANLRVFGVLTSVIVLSIIGLKYIISSVDEKATYKENMIPYVIGCVLLASATTLPSLIYELAKWK